MERVVVAAGADGLGQMLADLVRGNLAAHPERVALLDGVRGQINIRAEDAGVEVGLFFTGRELSVGSPFPRPDIAITCDSETLMALSGVPLWMGRPDVRTAAGRAVVRKILARRLRIRGMLTHPRLLAQLQKLLSVA